MTRSTPPDPARRKLLGTARNAAALGAATALLPAARALPGQAVENTAAAPRAQPRGYHESEHTRTYYRLARY